MHRNWLHLKVKKSSIIRNNKDTIILNGKIKQGIILWAGISIRIAGRQYSGRSSIEVALLPDTKIPTH